MGIHSIKLIRKLNQAMKRLRNCEIFTSLNQGCFRILEKELRARDVLFFSRSFVPTFYSSLITLVAGQGHCWGQRDMFWNVWYCIKVGLIPVELRPIINLPGCVLLILCSSTLTRKYMFRKTIQISQRPRPCFRHLHRKFNSCSCRTWGPWWDTLCQDLS